MKTKKLLFLMLTIALVFSCKQEEVLDQSSGTADLTADISRYDNSNLGLYLGTFTTLDASERGILEVKILENVPSIATLTLSSGVNYILKSTATAEPDQYTNLSFVSVSESMNSLGFDLSVNADGTNIEIANTMLGSKASHILIVKETSRGVALAVPGTYVCTECGTHPSLGTGSQTFNAVFVSDPNGEGSSTMTTQFTLNGVVFTSPDTDNSQDGASCVDDGDFTACDISGFTTIGANAMTWSGTHTYNNTATNCSQMTGTWAHPGYGGISGTFTSDLQCVPAVVGDFIYGGVVFWVDPLDPTHGLVCAINDAPSILQWGCNGTDLSSVPNVMIAPPSGVGAEIGDGMSNTNGILTDCPDASASLYARSVGSEWFLPSINELNQMFINKAVINTTALNNGGSAFAGGLYWSSTENNKDLAWFQFFGDGSIDPFLKNFGFNVRAVRAF